MRFAVRYAGWASRAHHYKASDGYLVATYLDWRLVGRNKFGIGGGALRRKHYAAARGKGTSLNCRPIGCERASVFPGAFSPWT